MLPERPAAVVFDFDGVLVDSEPAHYRAFQEVLEPRGLGYSWQRYCEHFIGFDDRDGFREAFRDQGREMTGLELEELIREKHGAFERAMAAGLEPVPGAVACVEQLAAAYPLALCSGALRTEIEPTLRGLGLEGTFRVIVAAEDVTASKPDPVGYQLALAELGRVLGRTLDPGSCVAIEDTPTGVASARGAGLRVIGLDSSGAGSLTEADRVVPALDRIPALLGEAT